MAPKTPNDYAAQGITISKRERSGGDVTLYVRGHKQWVKVIRLAEARKWYFARGYEGDVTAHDRASYSMSAYRWTWNDAIAHAVQLIETWK